MHNAHERVIQLTTNTWIDKWFERWIQCNVIMEIWKKKHKNDTEQTSGAQIEDKAKLAVIHSDFQFIPISVSLLFCSIWKWNYDKLSVALNYDFLWSRLAIWSIECIYSDSYHWQTKEKKCVKCWYDFLSRRNKVHLVWLSRLTYFCANERKCIEMQWFK